MSDPVNSPSHYNQYGVQVIEITEHLNFNKGNVVKYVCRSAFKGAEIQDLEKARWYLDREIARLRHDT
jgi:translation elongation factor EF-1alpha